MRRLLFFAILGLTFFGGLNSYAQEHKFDFFLGADFNYKNTVQSTRIADFLITLTPGAKWRFGKDWTVSAQGSFPIVNNYGDAYKYPTLKVASVAKEFTFLSDQCFKLSGGIFSNNRYGVDAKWFCPVSPWFAMEAQVGFTGYYSMTSTWSFSKLDRFTGLLTTRFYLEKWETEFRLGGGRYNYGDYGVRAEWFKHFANFLSAGIFVQWGDKYGTYQNKGGELTIAHWGGGAKLIIMLPWQGSKEKKVRFRPASNIRLTYDYWADPVGMKTYMTDPEENERTGNFSNAKWGFTR